MDANAVTNLLQSFGGSTTDGEQHKARLKSLQNAVCRILYNIIPRQGLRIKDDALTVQTRLRLGMKARPHMIKCRCGAAGHDESANTHALRCRSNTRGWYVVHEHAVRALANAAQDAGYSVETRDFNAVKEEHHVVPDITMTGDGPPIVVDVSFSAVSCAHYRAADITDKNPKACSANQREVQKEKHYQTLTHGGSCVFSPLVLERETLAMGSASLALVDKIVMKSGGFTAKRALTRFTLLAKILIASSNGNAVLAEQAEKQDAMSEGRQSRQVMGSGFAEAGNAAALRVADCA